MVLAKADLRPAGDGLAVSGVTGAGVAELLDRIARDLQVRTAGAATASHARQIEAIERAAAAVERSLELLRAPGDRFEFAAAEIHAALRALDFLIGRVDVEAVLDVIFQSFCLGK